MMLNSSIAASLLLNWCRTLDSISLAEGDQLKAKRAEQLHKRPQSLPDIQWHDDSVTHRARDATLEEFCCRPAYCAHRYKFATLALRLPSTASSIMMFESTSL